MEEVSRAARYDLTEAYTLVAPHALVPYKTQISCLHYIPPLPHRCRRRRVALARGPEALAKGRGGACAPGSGPVVRASGQGQGQGLGLAQGAKPRPKR